MKNTLAFLVVLLFSTLSLAQETQYFQVNHPETGETYLIESGKVVRVVTNEGKRFKGHLRIIDENTIEVKGKSLLLTEIDKIKKMRTPLVVILGIVSVYAGLTAVGLGALVATFGGNGLAGGLIALGGVPIVYAGINGINPARGFKSFQGWQYSIVTAADLQPAGANSP